MRQAFSDGYFDGEFTGADGVNGLSVQAVTGTNGVDRYEDTDHTIFVVDSPVTTVDTWQGVRLPRRTWNTGDIIFLPANSEVKAKAENTYDETIISVPDRLFHEAARIDVDYGRIDFSYAQLNSFVLSDMANLIRRVANANEEFSPMLVENLSLSLAVSAAVALSPKVAKVIATLRNGLSPKRKQQALAYIEANLGRQVLLTEIAHAVALSPFHFARSFKETMGMSPMRYLLSRRIAAAKTMLRTSVPIAIVALSCGFLSQTHFTTAFKSATGKTPAIFRKALTVLVITLLSMQLTGSKCTPLNPCPDNTSGSFGFRSAQIQGLATGSCR